MAKIRARIWIEHHGECVLGDGRARLLQEIDERGSISAAARSLGMSYRHAWEHVRKIEQRLGRRVLERTCGGSAGGGSRLTPFARRLLGDFLRLRKDLEAFLAECSGLKLAVPGRSTPRRKVARPSRGCRARD